MEQLTKLAAEHEAKRILRVHVEIGRFSGVVADSFSFGFTALAPLAPLTRDAKLVIMSPTLQYGCRVCDQRTVKTGDAQPEHCPCCGSQDFFSLGDDDIILQQVEME